MSAEAYDIVDRERFAAMTWAEQNELLQLAGSCRHLMHSSQQACYDKYRAWEAIDPMSLPPVDGSFPLIFGMPVSKRWGKSSLCVWIKHEDAIRNPGRKYRITSAFDHSIHAIISDVQRQVFEHCPASVRPQYHGKRGARGSGFYYPEWGPAAGSVIYLDGLESNPDALRGQECDGDVISEAAFIKELLYVVRNVLYQQYQGKPHARMLLESSAPEAGATDWEMHFLPDFMRRQAFFSATIRDNPRLTPREIEHWEAAAGGKDSYDCQREYYNVIASDPDENVIPEFSLQHHVREIERPRHAYCITAMDPGQRNLFAVLFGYYDFDKDLRVIQDSWAEANASLRKVGAVIAAREFDLWGTWPHPKMKAIPLIGDGERQGWRDLLRGDRCQEHAAKLWEMANCEPEERADFARHPRAFEQKLPVGHFTYWDGANYRANPYMRSSDIALQSIRDLSEEYGIEVAPTTKEGLKVMVNHVRDGIGDGRYVMLPKSGPVIPHVKNARWPDSRDRTRFAEHPTYGHFDALATLIYWDRACELIQARRPHGPARPIPGPGVIVVDDLPWQTRPVQQQVQALNELLGRRGPSKHIHAGAPRRARR